METQLKKFYNYLKEKDSKGHRIIFFTTSNRWSGERELPKSSELALEIRNKLKNCEVIDVSKLKIFLLGGKILETGGINVGVKKR